MYLGGKESNKHASKKLRQGRGTVGKQSVIGLRERITGNVKAFPIADTRAETFEKNVKQNVAKGAIVYTDEHASYRNLSVSTMQFNAFCGSLQYLLREKGEGLAWKSSILSAP